MAIVIDATVSGSASNSYVTLTRAISLAEQLPHANDWLSDYMSNRNQLLVHATRLIDRHVYFHGTKTLSSQALEWPRVNVHDERTGAAIVSSTIPEFIEWATVEWAHQLYLDADQSGTIAPGITRLRTPSYEAEFSGGSQSVIPETVADLLLPYGQRVPRKRVYLSRV